MSINLLSTNNKGKKEGDIMQDIELKHIIDSLQDCDHPCLVNNECTACAESITNCGNLTTLPFRYIQPNLTLTSEEIRCRREDNLQSLISRRKLNLFLDLDHTLLHATSVYYNEFNMPEEDIQLIKAMDDTYEICNGTFIVKLRPGVHDFLEQVRTMFDVSIYTLSSEIYASEVVKLLDTKDGSSSRFSWVITREDCINPHQKGLDIVLSHERVVLVVDDLKTVWRDSGSENLIRISPYYCSTKEKAKKMDKELVRVLKVLKAVHSAFYDDDAKVDYSNRDVRTMLQRVLSKQNTNTIKSFLSCITYMLYGVHM